MNFEAPDLFKAPGNSRESGGIIANKFEAEKQVMRNSNIGGHKMGSNINGMKNSLIFDMNPPMLTETSIYGGIRRDSNGNTGQMRESLPVGLNLQRGPKTGIFSDNFEQKGMENVSYNNRSGRGVDRHLNQRTVGNNVTGIPQSRSQSRGNVGGYQPRDSAQPVGQGHKKNNNDYFGSSRKSYGLEESSGGHRVQSKGFRQSNIGNILF
jgi:hypothetical protein